LEKKWRENEVKDRLAKKNSCEQGWAYAEKRQVGRKGAWFRGLGVDFYTKGAG